MTDDTERVLAAIDETLDRYVTWDGASPDAMVWKADTADQDRRARPLPSWYTSPTPWCQEQPYMALAHGGEGDVAWRPLGRIADDGFVFTQPVLDAEAIRRSFNAFGEALRPQIVSLRRAITEVGKAFTTMVNRSHPALAPAMYRDDYRRHHRACRLCNPAGNPKPLKIDGAEYRRRRNRRSRG